MTLRPLLLSTFATVAIGVAAVPASSLAADEPAWQAGEAMRDPANQQRMAAAVRGLSDALLDLRIAPFLRAIEAAGGGAPEAVDPDLRLRDYAGPEAEQIPREMSRRLPGMMDAFGDMAAAFQAALPELAAAADSVRDRIEGGAGR